jgi:tripartite-type tricarboxylate transporter receptor subunit TctC
MTRDVLRVLAVGALILAGCSPAAPPGGGAPAQSAAAPSSAGQAAVDFKGKTIRLIVGYNAGGGFDANARVLTPHLQQALPGNPTIVVENMPGADSLVAAKTVLTAPQRGDDISIVVYVSTLLVKSVLKGGLDGFAIEKESAFIGLPDSAPQALALCARKSVVPNLESFLSRSQPIKLGGLTGGSYYDALLRWTKEAGFPVEIVFGYSATAPMILAFNQGEVDAMPACRDQDIQQNPDWIEQDAITPLFTYANTPEAFKKAQSEGKYPWLRHAADVKPLSNEMKTILDTINEVNAGTNVYAVSKQTPAPVRDALQRAFKEAVSSTAFTADMQKRQLQGGYRSPEEIAQILQDVERSSPTQKDLLARMLGA